MPRPLLFCFDGSAGSKAAMRAAVDLVVHPSEAVVLAVWQPAAARLALAGAFAPMAMIDEAEVDGQEEASARAVAEEGAAAAKEHGLDATALVAQASTDVAHTILDVAERLDASLIVCGQRGRGHMSSALLGSVSHALSSHARRPVLISPDHPEPAPPTRA